MNPTTIGKHHVPMSLLHCVSTSLNLHITVSLPPPSHNITESRPPLNVAITRLLVSTSPHHCIITGLCHHNTISPRMHFTTLLRYHVFTSLHNTSSQRHKPLAHHFLFDRFKMPLCDMAVLNSPVSDTCPFQSRRSRNG